MTANTSTDEYVIEAEDLRRVYKRGKQEVYALRGVNLKIGTNRFIALFRTE